MASNHDKEKEFFKSLAAFKQEFIERLGLPVGLKTLVGATYVESLESMTRAQAARYLRLAPDGEVLKAYVVLSRRLPQSTLRQLCTEFVQRPASVARSIGIREIGPLMLATRNRNLSKALARIARDPTEKASERVSAYRSLESINSREIQLRPVQLELGKLSEDPIAEIDWALVDRFV